MEKSEIIKFILSRVNKTGLNFAESQYTERDLEIEKSTKNKLIKIIDDSGNEFAFLVGNTAEKTLGNLARYTDNLIKTIKESR